MKIKLIVVLCLALSLLLCACGGANETLEDLQVNVGEALEDMTQEASAPEETQTEPQQSEEETEPEETKGEEVPATPVETPTQPKPTEPPVTEPEPTEPPKVEVKNEFFNDSNNFYENGQVNVRPRHMYWDGDVLVAQCFVINGLDKPVFNINVEDLDFSNGNGLIADAQFGILQGVTLQPHTHVLWTFKFGSDVVYQSGGDLSSIDYHSSVSFDH